VPGADTPEEALLDLAAHVLGGSKTSRLYQRLVVKDQLATSAFASDDSSEIAGQFGINLTARPGADVAKHGSMWPTKSCAPAENGPTPEAAPGQVRTASWPASCAAPSGSAASAASPTSWRGLTMAMLSEGTTHRDGLTISRELAQLGAGIGGGGALDYSNLSLNTLTTTVDPALAIYADVLRNPAFKPEDLDRQKRQRIASVQQQKQNPNAMASRLLPALAYGEGSPYGQLTTEASLASITRDDLVRFQKTWLQPKGATLVVVGDTTLEEIVPKLEAQLGGWSGAPAKTKAPVDAPATKGAVYLIDKPGAQQSMIMAGNLLAPRDPKDEAAIDTVNALLGGDFVSRLNMNLREDKHWSYGAGSYVRAGRGTRMFVAYAPVQTDKTAESFTEARKELSGVIGDKPVTAAELAKAQNGLILSMPGTWETSGAVGGSITELVNYNLPDGYFDAYPGQVRAVTTDTATAAAKKAVKPSEMIWVIVGDRAVIEPKLKGLGLDLKVVDADGKAVK
jgi:zinc protease